MVIIMKINEKNLCSFAISPPVDLEGYLSKRGEINKSWQRRYFILKGNLLFYFERKGDREPLGVIIIEGCTIELSEDSEQYGFQIVFHGINNRSYFLSAESQEQMEQWMKALTCAGYEYMKLMVSELQRQLEEIEGTNVPSQQPNTSVAPKPPPRRQNPFNRTAPPPPQQTSNTTQSLNHANSNGNNNNNDPIIFGGGNGGGFVSSTTTIVPTATLITLSPLKSSATTIPSSSSSSSTTEEYTFSALHKAFGELIMPEIIERQKLMALNCTDQPLIVL